VSAASPCVFSSSCTINCDTLVTLASLYISSNPNIIPTPSASATIWSSSDPSLKHSLRFNLSVPVQHRCCTDLSIHP
jgi:hypothetical protein